MTTAERNPHPAPTLHVPQPNSLYPMEITQRFCPSVFSNLYSPVAEGQNDDGRDGDPLLELLCWLSNVVRMYNHVTSAEFRSRLAAPQPPSDVMESLQELCESFEEMITFMFQQTVYSITKVSYAYLN